MSISPIDSNLFSGLYTTSEMSAIFSDEQFLAHMLDVEIALARVQSELDVIPHDEANLIVESLKSFTPDLVDLADGVEKSGVPTIAFVNQLRKHVGGSASEYIHWGATTQDILDTAAVLQYRAGLSHIEDSLNQLIKSLANLADKHRSTLMAGRTYIQQAVPMSFGGKVANWLAPLLRHRERLSEIKPRILVVQFGGAVGTLASLNDQGARVHDALAKELNLNILLIPWHTQRDSIIELANWLTMLTGNLGKIAQDVMLMAQSEIAEIDESDDPSRGGSSTMPQKHNPVLSSVILACARTNIGLLSGLYQTIIQEHERGTSGLHIERLHLPQMFALTAAALHHSLFLSDHMLVDNAAMRKNLDESRGLLLAEAISFALSQYMSRADAKKLLTTASRQALGENQHLIDIIREQVNFPLDWSALKDEANYLGSTDEWINRVLHQAEREQE